MKKYLSYATLVRGYVGFPVDSFVRFNLLVYIVSEACRFYRTRSWRVPRREVSAALHHTMPLLEVCNFPDLMYSSTRSRHRQGG